MTARGARGWHQSVWGVVKRTLEGAYEDNLPFLASALSFDVILTSIPFLVLLLAVVGTLVQHQITTQQMDLAELLRRFMPAMGGGGGGSGAAAINNVERVLEQVVASRGQLTLVGLPLFLYFSTRLFGGLRAALNEVFDTEERRPWPLAKLIDLALVLLTGTLLLLSALLPALEARTLGQMGDGFLVEWLYRLSLEIVAFGFSTLLFLVVFKVLPSRRIAWRTAVVAAVICALAFELAKRLYALYVAHFVTLDRLASNANAGAFFLLILWIYYTNCVFLIGGEIAEAYDLARMRRAQRVQLG
jgi:membrane protein